MASLAGWRPVLLMGLALAALTGPALGQPPEPRWVLGTSILGGYQSHIDYTSVPPEGDFGSRLAVRLGYRFKLQRAQFLTGLGVGTTLYRRVTDRNQITWDAGLVGAWPLSRRTTVDARVRTLFGYGFGYADTLEDVAIPPDTLRRQDSFGASLRHRLSRSIEGRLEVFGTNYDFDSSEPFFRDGWSVTARAGLERSLSAESVVGALAEYERTATYGQSFEIERLLVGWRKPVIRHLVVALEGGVARYRLIDLPPADLVVSGEPSITPTGGAELIGRFGDHTLTVEAARTVGQMFGVGDVGVYRSFSLGYAATFGSRFGFTARATDVEFLEGAASAPLLSRRQQARSGLSYAVGRGLEARLYYSYWRHGDSSAYPDGHTVWIGVGREFTWR